MIDEAPPKIDARYKAAKEFLPFRAEVACAIRCREGLTAKEIASRLGASPAWIDMALWEGGARFVPPRTMTHEVISARAKAWWCGPRGKKIKYDRAKPKRARRREVEQRKRLRAEAAKKRRERVERVRRRRQAQSAVRRAWKSPVRLDAPLGDAPGSEARGKIVARPHDDTDPFTYVESKLLAGLVGDLSIAEIEQLDERTLSHLRGKLRDAGFAPPNVQWKERERLREPERHRGYGSAPSHSRMSTKRKHRKPGHQKSAGSKRGSRKQRTFRDVSRRPSKRILP